MRKHRREQPFGKVAPLAVVLVMVLSFGTAAAGDESLLTLNGRWEGAIQVMGQSLVITVNFSAGDEPAGTIDIPQQGAVKLPLSNIRHEPPALHFELAAPVGTAVFDGNVAGDEISGAFYQRGIGGSFSLRRVAGNSPEPAGQDAAEAFQEGSGKAERVALETPTGKIHGTLLFPDTADKVPVVLIIAGSGPTDRDGNSAMLPGRNDSLKLLALGLAQEGIASLRYDKRGIGESQAAGTTEADLRFDDYVNDVAAWVKFLKEDARVSSVAVLGHSEGSLIGIVAAARAPVNALVSMAGAGRPAYDVLLDQLADQPAPIRQESRAIIEQLKEGDTVAGVSQELMPLFRPSVQPYLISWFKYDPATEMSRLSIPVLIVQGTHDLQVSVDEARLLHRAKPGATLKIVDGMNHVLKEVPADPETNLASYSDPTLCLAPGLLEEVVAFLKGSLK